MINEALRKAAVSYTLVDNESVEAWYRPAKGQELVVTFGGIGRDTSVKPQVEFMGTAFDEGANHVLAFIDLKRSWYSDAAVLAGVRRAFVEALALSQPRRIYGIGHSMGGYAAILFAAEMGFDVTVSIAPQFSLKPAIVKDPRWSEFSPAFGPAMPDSIGPALDAAPGTVWMLHGMMGPDIRHYLEFKMRPGVIHGLAEGITHKLGEELKEQGCIKPFVRAALSGDEDAAKEALNPFTFYWRQPDRADEEAEIRAIRTRIQDEKNSGAKR